MVGLLKIILAWEMFGSWNSNMTELFYDGKPDRAELPASKRPQLYLARVSEVQLRISAPNRLSKSYKNTKKKYLIKILIIPASSPPLL